MCRPITASSRQPLHEWIAGVATSRRASGGSPLTEPMTPDHEPALLSEEVAAGKCGISLRGAFIPDSRCRAVIFVDQPAKSIHANDCAVSTSGLSRLRRLECEAAVRAFFVIVPEVLSQDAPPMALPGD